MREHFVKLVSLALHPPIFEDEEKTRAAALLNTLIWASLVGSMAFLIVAIGLVPELRDRAFYVIPLLPIFVVLLWLSRRGYVKSASIALVLVIWIIIALASYSAGGVRAAAFPGFVVTILFAGFLLGHRLSIVLVGLTIVLGLGFLSGESSGWLPSRSPYDSWVILVINGIFETVSAVLLYLVTASLQNSMARIQQSEQQLAERNRLLRHEIEERKRAEEALRTSEEQYRQLFEANPHPMYVMDLGTLEFLAVNDAFLMKYGYEREEILKLTGKDLRPVEDVASFVNDVETFVQKEWAKNRAGIWRHRKKDGSIIYVEGAMHSLTYKGRFVSLVAAYDLTERLRTEEALRRSEELFWKVFQTVPVAISISTMAEGRILSMNRYMLELIGFESHDTINHLVSELGYWASLDERNAFVDELRETGSVMGMEATWIMKSGATLDMFIALQPIEVNGVSCVLVIGLDITERKQIEQDRLEAERVHLEIQKERDVLELKERFISTMSHEFRTPLAVILSAKDTLEHYFDRLTPERRIEKLHNIGEQVHFLSAMMEDVLTIGKARAGKMKFSPALIDLGDLCKTLFEQLQATDRIAHKYVLTVDGDLEAVYADKLIIQHVLVNLLSNAVKYSPEGGEVRLALNRQGEEVVIMVGDQGIGIPEDDQKQLFQPFYRASNTGAIKGTGLGLAIVKESLEAHSGIIRCESVPGQGTRFFIQLPITPPL